MRKYETLKWLKRLLLVVGGIALAMLIFMLMLDVSSRVGRGGGGNAKPAAKAAEQLPKPSAAEPIVHVTDRGDTGRRTGEELEHYDLGTRIRNDDGESLMASGAAAFADEYAAAVASKDEDFLTVSLNREVIEKYGYRLAACLRQCIPLQEAPDGRSSSHMRQKTRTLKIWNMTWRHQG